MGVSELYGVAATTVAPPESVTSYDNTGGVPVSLKVTV